ncbi:PC-esterase domain-containing protein 1A isoform X3 [Sinocyclocheilus rhinocerous]|uniref:PC-esterase domain-containing protein 1A isoform X3 n=1 Tax=Sinocyclocheilus rhinocerous TaxID=307959 RepID=UPI0007B95492|nr:PREDICTED: PC-esterase domain-containing protein 1A-like isoform X3 [Sinocyclocheilus rhinocerous]
MRPVTQRTAKQLLHSKFVVVLGDSIQRSVYKDLVLMLRRDAYLSVSQLKSKGEFSFEQDFLVEGGRLGEMNNGTAYKEVRQYRTDHHLIRFYFVTRVFSRYMESILTDFETGMKPDLVIVNSCVWDISRYSREWATEYRNDLNTFFSKLKAILLTESLVVWNMTMPLGKKIVGGFLVPEIQHMGPTLRFDVIEANYFGATLANEYGFDVLDFHFQFRFSLQHRMQDGVHWNAVAHRQITCLLLEHVAQAWGVELPDHDQVKADGHPPLHDSHNWKTATSSALVRHQAPAWTQGQMMRQFSGFGSQFSGYGAQFYSDSVPPHLTAGYQSFEREPFYRGVNSAAAPYWPVNNFVMKRKQRRPYNPYTRERPRTYRY